MSTSIAARAANPDWKQQFAKVSDDYFDQVYFHYAPSAGTMVGLHQYDSQLEDFSRPSHRRGDRRAEELRAADRSDRSR